MHLTNPLTKEIWSILYEAPHTHSHKLMYLCIMAKRGVVDLRTGHLVIFAVLFLPTYSRSLLVELENDGSGKDFEVLGSQGASQKGKTTLQGAAVISA